MSETAFTIVLLLLSIVLIAILLLQVRGNAGQIFGQAESTFRSRRGVERLLFRATIVVSAIFVVAAILNARFTN